MKKLACIMAASAAFVALSGCMSVGGPGVSTYLECDRGTRLKVDYGRNGALVTVNDARRPISLRETPSNDGRTFEGRGGERLSVEGRGATWNTAGRSAPERCREVAVPR